MKQFKYFSYFIILHTVLTQGQSNDNKVKISIVEEIVRKITNMTLKSLSEVPASEKQKLVKNIEEKVKKSASNMGADGHKYIKIIMHGVKLVAFNHTTEIDHTFTTSEKGIFIMRAHNSNEDKFLHEEETMKKQAINSIAAKIERLANKYLKEAKTQKERLHIIESIKNKVMDTANRRHMMIHNKHDEIKSFSNLISKGVDLMMKRNLKDESNGRNFEHINDTRRQKTRIETESSYTNMVIHTNHTSRIPECKYEIGKTCAAIKSLNKLTCIYDKKVFPLERLCDGVIDCMDRSDEEECSVQAVERIRRVERIMTKVDDSLIRKCAMSNLNSRLASKQNNILRSVLQSQLKFLEKYTDTRSSQMLKSNNGDISKKSLQKIVNGAALVVSSLGMALDGSLCARRMDVDKFDDIANTYTNEANADKVFDGIFRRQSVVLRSCDCNGPYCSYNSCTETCKHICWQKYNLDRWSCKAVGDNPSVPLDVICDGKLDCYDESDESNCALGAGYTKFEANAIYDNILKLLSIKINSKEYHWILNELLTLRDTIKLLQKMSIKQNIEMMNIKIIRDQIFTSIIAIYEKYLHKGDDNTLNGIYDFLMSLNKKLVGAMKRSRTGNDRIISPVGCYCIGARCGLQNCSKLCLRACSVEALLTRYNCGNIKQNNSVPIESLCNGKSNCPNGEDEIGCKKEVCRHHHLVLLRHNLQDVGNKHKGTGLGEALISWRTKVISTLMIAEKSDRPKPKIFKRMISELLNDLVMSYANLEEFRRNTNERTVNEFERLSQQVIESVKTCGK